MKYIIIAIGIIFAIAVFGLMFIFPFFYAYGTDEIVECSVTEKERVVSSNSSRYLIFCDEEVLENSDSFLYWKFSSSDFYRDIKEGESYEFRVYGWRVPFLSWYRNIIEINQIT